MHTAGFFVVKKRGCGLQPCIDYWGLNQVGVKYSYLMSLVLATLEQLREAKIFTRLNLWTAYNLVHIQEGDNGSTTSGHTEYCAMPYGLSSSSTLFQCLITDALWDMLGIFVIAYINDI